MGFGFLPRVWLLERSFEIGVCMRLGFWVRSSGFPAAVPKVVAKPAT